MDYPLVAIHNVEKKNISLQMSRLEIQAPAVGGTAFIPNLVNFILFGFCGTASLEQCCELDSSTPACLPFIADPVALHYEGSAWSHSIISTGELCLPNLLLSNDHGY